MIPTNRLVPSSLNTIDEKINSGVTDLIDSVSERNKYEDCIIISEYITQETRKKLVAKEVSYCDLQGNIYLNLDWFYAEIESPQSRKEYKRQSDDKAFNHKGLRVTKEFILSPELVHLPYRELSKEMKGKYAIDTIKRVVDNLRDLSFLTGERKERELINISELTEQWFRNFETIEDKEKRKLIADKNELIKLKKKL